MFALATAERWYYTGWAGMQVVTNKKKRARPVPRTGHLRAQPVSRSGSAAAALMKRLLPAPVRAIVQKDFMLLRRDMRNLSGLVTPLIFGVFYTIMFLRPGGSMFPDTPDMPRTLVNISHFISTYGNIGMSLFVGWMLLVRLSGMAFSAEGKILLDFESFPGAHRAPAGCQVPGGLPANPGPGRDLHGGGLDPAKSFALPSSCMACWPRSCARPA